MFCPDLARSVASHHATRVTSVTLADPGRKSEKKRRSLWQPSDQAERAFALVKFLSHRVRKELPIRRRCTRRGLRIGWDPRARELDERGGGGSTLQTRRSSDRDPLTRYRFARRRIILSAPREMYVNVCTRGPRVQAVGERNDNARGSSLRHWSRVASHSDVEQQRRAT